MLILFCLLYVVCEDPFLGRSSDDGTCRIWDARQSNAKPRIYIPKPLVTLAGLFYLLFMKIYSLFLVDLKTESE